MTNLKISITESLYLLYMFLFFKTSVDFNIFDSPRGKYFEHLIGNEYGLRICLFGQKAIFVLIGILLGRHYINIPQWFINISLGISFVLSLMNMNAVVYMLPVWFYEIYAQL